MVSKKKWVGLLLVGLTISLVPQIMVGEKSKAIGGIKLQMVDTSKVLTQSNYEKYMSDGKRNVWKLGGGNKSKVTVTLNTSNPDVKTIGISSDTTIYANQLAGHPLAGNKVRGFHALLNMPGKNILSVVKRNSWGRSYSTGKLADIKITDAKCFDEENKNCLDAIVSVEDITMQTFFNGLTGVSKGDIDRLSKLDWNFLALRQSTLGADTFGFIHDGFRAPYDVPNNSIAYATSVTLSMKVLNKSGEDVTPLVGGSLIITDLDFSGRNRFKNSKGSRLTDAECLQYAKGTGNTIESCSIGQNNNLFENVTFLNDSSTLYMPNTSMVSWDSARNMVKSTDALRDADGVDKGTYGLTEYTKGGVALSFPTSGSLVWSMSYHSGSSWVVFSDMLPGELKKKHDKEGKGAQTVGTPVVYDIKTKLSTFGFDGYNTPKSIEFIDELPEEVDLEGVTAILLDEDGNYTNSEVSWSAEKMITTSDDGRRVRKVHISVPSKIIGSGINFFGGKYYVIKIHTRINDLARTKNLKVPVNTVTETVNNFITFKDEAPEIPLNVSDPKMVLSKSGTWNEKDDTLEYDVQVEWQVGKKPINKMVIQDTPSKGVTVKPETAKCEYIGVGKTFACKMVKNSTGWQVEIGGMEYLNKEIVSGKDMNRMVISYKATVPESERGKVQKNTVSLNTDVPPPGTSSNEVPIPVIEPKIKLEKGVRNGDSIDAKDKYIVQGKEQRVDFKITNVGEDPIINVVLKDVTNHGSDVKGITCDKVTRLEKGSVMWCTGKLTPGYFEQHRDTATVTGIGVTSKKVVSSSASWRGYNGMYVPNTGDKGFLWVVIISTVFLGSGVLGLAIYIRKVNKSNEG